MELVSLLTKVCRRSEMSIRNMKRVSRRVIFLQQLIRLSSSSTKASISLGDYSILSLLHFLRKF